MTDHLADARACAASASRSPSVATAVSWLNATCEQIIDHLEAQQTEASLRRGLADITAGCTVDLGSFAQPATAPPAAQQGDSGHGDGYTPTTDEVEHRYAYDELYSMDCEADHRAFRRWLAAHDAEVREQVAGDLHYEAKAMTRFNAHPAMADAGATATAYREGIRDGLTAAAHIALQEQP